MHLSLLSMFWRYIVIGLLIYGTAIEADAQQRDSILLRNGQLLIGEIKEAQLEVISIDDRDMGMLYIKMYKIKTMCAVKRFRIETSDRQVYFGRLAKSDTTGSVIILLEEGKTMPMAIKDLSLLIAIGKKFITRLDGSLAGGFSYTRSSDDGLTNLSFLVQYVSRMSEYALNISLNGSMDSVGYSRDRENISLFGAWFATPSWFLAGSFDYERNLELSIARRYQQLIGGGNKIFVRPSLRLLAITGITLNQEKSTAGESSDLLVEIPFVVRFNYFKYHRPNLQLSSSQSLFYGLTQLGRVRYTSNTKFSWELTNDFYLNITPYINFDSEPPEGNNKIDFGMSLSLSFKF
jgi:hypothetical protein